MTQPRRTSSVFQRKEGRWVVTMKDPSTGTRITHYATSQAEARRKLRALRRRLLWKSLFRKRER